MSFIVDRLSTIGTELYVIAIALTVLALTSIVKLIYLKKLISNSNYELKNKKTNKQDQS